VKTSTGAKAHRSGALNAALKRRSSTSPWAARSQFLTEFLIWEQKISCRDGYHIESVLRNITIRRTDEQRTFFVTTVARGRAPIFRNEQRARLLIDVLFDYRAQGKYLLLEFVVMPDHLHAILTPSAKISLERTMQFIKGGFSYRMRKIEKIQVWQESFTNHRIRDADDFERHREYVRMNPVRAKLVRNAREYLYSSAHAAFVVDEVPRGLKPIYLFPRDTALKRRSSTSLQAVSSSPARNGLQTAGRFCFILNEIPHFSHPNARNGAPGRQGEFPGKSCQGVFGARLGVCG